MSISNFQKPQLYLRYSYYRLCLNMCDAQLLKQGWNLAEIIVISL